MSQKKAVKTSQKRNSRIKLLFIGRLRKNKGLHLLIEALSEIKKNNWSLSVVGEGSEKENLEKLAAEMGIIKRVTFYGFRKDVDSFYRSHDILIVPSLNEPFGRVVIEGMQTGIAIIASDSGGIPEIIDNGKNGILFGYNDIGQLRCAIEDLLDNRDKRIRIGLMGKEDIKTRFSEEDFSRKLMAAYYELAKNNQ